MGATFCGHCGERIASVGRSQTRDALDDDGNPARRRDRRRTARQIALIALVALVAAALIVGGLQLRSERNARQRDVADLTSELGVTQQKLTLAQAQSATLGKRLATLERKFARSNPNVAALARSVLRSVYTVESGQELGTAWIAWRNPSYTYLITANHVVADAVAAGDNQVTLRQKNASYEGTVLKTDETNDLALIRTDSSVPGGPLWQKP